MEDLTSQAGWVQYHTQAGSAQHYPGKVNLFGATLLGATLFGATLFEVGVSLPEGKKTSFLFAFGWLHTTRQCNNPYIHQLVYTPTRTQEYFSKSLHELYKLDDLDTLPTYFYIKESQLEIDDKHKTLWILWNLCTFHISGISSIALAENKECCS